MVGIGATTAMLGVLLSQVLGISRMMLAMARRSDLLRTLTAVHPNYSVPHHGIILTGIAISLLVIFGSLEWIIAAATFTILLYYGVTNIAALRLPREYRLYPDWVPVLGAISCALLALSLEAKTIASGLSVLA